MTSIDNKLKIEIESLCKKDDLLYYKMGEETSQLSPELKKMIKDSNIKLPDFKKEYEIWYSESL